MKTKSSTIILQLLIFAITGSISAQQISEKIIHSVKSGNWSDTSTWSSKKIPGAGEKVQVRSGHTVTYDIESDQAIRAIHVAGTLTFSTDKNTRLDVGLIRIEAGDKWKEGGFDCHTKPVKPDDSKPRPSLIIGTQNSPVRAKTLIRLVYFEGDDPKTLPAIVCCSGRMDIHGAPMNRTWLKLAKPADAGDYRIYLDGDTHGWNEGDRIVVTATSRQRGFSGKSSPHVTGWARSEERIIKQIGDYGVMVRSKKKSDESIIIDEPLKFDHKATDNYAGEVANLSRNVVIESADPNGVRGHTMYHKYSKGSISYAEFRHLGKKDELGKYAIHFHLAGDSMRGSSVIGASIWDSHNRWITIHGTRYMVIRDCVGYQSIGHGFFLEDGTEVYNSFDRNIAIQALIGKALPDQALAYDRNDGAGFWWANSLNSFTRNAAVECDQHGFRFEVEKTDDFNPVMAVPDAAGKKKMVDLRTLPFIRFDDNEVHAHRRFGLNLGGIRGMVATTKDRIQTYSVGGHVDGVGPDEKHPFVIRNFLAWDCHWSFHSLSPSVLVEGMKLLDGQYGIWRSVVSRHVYNDLNLGKFDSSAIFFPMGGYAPKIKLKDGRPSFPQLKPTDDLPPATVITGIQVREGKVLIEGTTLENNLISEVIINGKQANNMRDNFTEWSVTLPVSSIDNGIISAHAVDDSGNKEILPHVIVLDKKASAQNLSK